MHDDSSRDNCYTTMDAYRAAFLVMHGFDYDLLDEGRDKFVFCFPLTLDLKNTLAKYGEGAEVEAVRFADTVKALKGDIFSRKRGMGYDARSFATG